MAAPTASSLDTNSLKLQGEFNASQISLPDLGSQLPSVFGLGSQDGIAGLGTFPALPGGSEPQNSLTEHLGLQSQGLQLASQGLTGTPLLPGVAPLQQDLATGLMAAAAQHFAVLSAAQLAHAQLNLGLLSNAGTDMMGVVPQPQPMMNLDVLHGKQSGLDPSVKHPSLLKPEHRNSKASRRGPMDDMRQLVRILVKIFPQSIHFLQMGEEGGGNRVSEPQIKEYLRRTLGTECPQPEWGLPQGWGEYIAMLFSWGLGKPVSQDQAMKCARRQQGRSWEVVEAEIGALGIYTYAWPLPLTQEGVRKVQANPPQPPRNSGFAGPWAKAMAEAQAAAAVSAKRAAPGTPTDATDVDAEAKRKLKRACTTGPSSPAVAAVPLLSVPAPVPAPVPVLSPIDEAALHSATARLSLLGILSEALQHQEEVLKYVQAAALRASRTTQPDASLAAETLAAWQSVQQHAVAIQAAVSQALPAIAPHTQQHPPVSQIGSGTGSSPSTALHASSTPTVAGRPAQQLPPMFARTGAGEQAAGLSLPPLQAPVQVLADVAPTGVPSNKPSTCSFSSEEDELNSGPSTHANGAQAEAVTTTADPTSTAVHVKDEPSTANGNDSRQTTSQRGRSGSSQELRNQIYQRFESVGPAAAATSAASAAQVPQADLRQNIMALLGGDAGAMINALAAFQHASKPKAEAT